MSTRMLGFWKFWVTCIFGQKIDVATMTVLFLSLSNLLKRWGTLKSWAICIFGKNGRCHHDGTVLGSPKLDKKVGHTKYLDIESP